MSICISGGAALLVLTGSSFTLSWVHSVEKTQWVENWSVVQDKLQLDQARVKGSGAGMDPGEGAMLEDGWWVWKPATPPVERLVLAASGTPTGGWTLCISGACHEIGKLAQAPLTVESCIR